jgi:hypothetical protein
MSREISNKNIEFQGNCSKVLSGKVGGDVNKLKNLDAYVLHSSFQVPGYYY